MDDDYGAPVTSAVMLPYSGATSFADIDAAEQAEGAWEAIADLLSQFQAIMCNIVCAPDDVIAIADKPGIIQAQTREFLSRLSDLPDAERKAIMGDTAAEGKGLGFIERVKGFLSGGEKAATEPVEGADAAVAEKAADDTAPAVDVEPAASTAIVIPEASVTPFINPAVAKALQEFRADKATKTEDGVEYNRSDFAVRGDADTPTTWKLRLAEGKPGNVTVAQVARAITAMQPGGFRGNEVNLGSGEKGEAVRNISAAIGKLAGSGTDAGKIDTLRNRLAAVKDLGPALRVFKDAEGHWRYLFRASNKWRDRDYAKHPKGEILSEEAHKEFVAWCDANNVYPEAWLWHTLGTKWGTGDFASYDSGFLIVSGRVDAGKEAVAKQLEADIDAGTMGASLGFLYRPKDRDSDGVYWQYRGFEVSALPIDWAANEVTSLDLTRMAKEIGNMIEPAEKREFLVRQIGEGAVAQLEASNATISKELDGVVEWKSLMDALPAVKEAEAPAAVVETPVPAPAVAEAAPVAEAVAAVPTPAPITADEIGKAIAAHLGPIAASAKAASDGVAAINARLDQRDAAEKAAAETLANTPRAADIFGARPTELASNVIDSAKADAKASTADPADPFLASVMGGTKAAAANAAAAE